MSDKHRFNLRRAFPRKSKRPPSKLSRKLERWSIKVSSSLLIKALLLCVMLLAATLLFLLAQASVNSEFFEKNYAWLYRLNIGVGVALTLIVSFLIARLFLLYRSGRFGTRLLAKLAFIFGLVGVLPGVILYTMSLQFVSRSIESWFDVKVESALESGLSLGRVSLDSLMNELLAKASNMALQLSEAKTDNPVQNLNQLREQYAIQDATLIASNGRLIATASASLSNDNAMAPNLPSLAVLKQAKLSRAYSIIEGAAFDTDVPYESAEAHIQLRVIVPVNLTNLVSSYNRSDSLVDDDNNANLLNGLSGSLIASSSKGIKPTINRGLASGLMDEPVYLQLIQSVPSNLAKNALAVQNAYREYQEKSLSRIGLRKMYIGTLTLTLCLGVFAALTLAILLGNQLARPLLLLAEGTKSVAGGDFSPLAPIKSNDELGVLTQSFNRMIYQLGEARKEVQKHSQAQENTNAYLKNILANLSAGVLVLDTDFNLILTNQGAERILRRPLQPMIGKPLHANQEFISFAEQIEKGFVEQNSRLNKALASSKNTTSSSDKKGHTWQRQIELSLADMQENAHELPPELSPHQVEMSTLLVRGSRLPLQAGTGYIVIFDDISEVISAQRSLAWGEVARRLAHEIKNPLTPIQLSAERLVMKLADKLNDADASMLKRSANTIVNQVQAMKRMVNDFRDYARLPAPIFATLNLNDLVTEVLTLYANELDNGIITTELDRELPQFAGDAAQLVQVIHNLVQNAQDAIIDNDNPQIHIKTERVFSTGSPEQTQAIQITIADNGTGFPHAMLSRAFEPYVTTKAKGTGLGLAVVKKIIDEHEGRIELRNLIENEGQTNSKIVGAQVAILFLKIGELAPSQASSTLQQEIDKKVA